MWLPVSTVAAICVLLEFCEANPPHNQLDLVFKERSRSEWQDAWHKERHVRCKEKIIRHLYWACEKDIYRVTRRNDPEEVKMSIFEFKPFFPWISPRIAKKMVKSRRGYSRRSGSSITSECCSPNGCTWEEYAEYCPTNKRVNTFL